MNRFALVLSLAASLACAGTVSAQGAHVTGVVIDPSGALLPGVTVTVEHADATERSTTSVKTDRTGRYDFADLRPGSYTLSASVPGFEIFRTPMNLEAGDYRERTLQLQIGSLQETIMVTPGDTPQPYSGAPRVAPPPPPPPPPPAPGAIRIGGNIKPPTMVARVAPMYPAGPASQGIEGTVSLIATIGGDGYVRDINIVSSANDEFSQSATNAVSQWQFTPTLLNGQPIDVKMRVNVLFRKN